MLSLISGLLMGARRLAFGLPLFQPPNLSHRSTYHGTGALPGQASGGERSLLPDDSLDIASILQTLANLGARVARASTLLCWHAEQFCHVLLHFCTIAPLQKQRSRLAARWLP